MESGIEITTQGNWNRKKILINDEYKNLIFSRKIKLTDCTKIGSKEICLNPWYDVTGMDMYGETAIMGTADVLRLPLTNDDLFLAVTLDYSVPPDKNKLGGSFFSWGFYNGAKCVYVPQGADIDNIYIYVYNLTPTRASENSSCGIQVYNAEGQVVYDSNEKYMNVIIADISGWGGHTITAEDLKEWPNVAISMPFMEMVTPKQGVDVQFFICARYAGMANSPTTYLDITGRYKDINTKTLYSYWGRRTDMVIDVTNL